MLAQIVLYVVAVTLIGLGAFGAGGDRVSLPLLGAACALLAYAWPVIAR